MVLHSLLTKTCSKDFIFLLYARMMWPFFWNFLTILQATGFFSSHFHMRGCSKMLGTLGNDCFLRPLAYPSISPSVMSPHLLSYFCDSFLFQLCKEKHHFAVGQNTSPPSSYSLHSQSCVFEVSLFSIPVSPC